MSAQTRRAFAAHYVRAFIVGDQATVAAYEQAATDHDAQHPGAPSLVDQLADAARGLHQPAAA